MLYLEPVTIVDKNIMQLQIDIMDLNIWHDSTSRDTWNWRTLAEWGHTPSRAFIMFIVSGAGRVFQTKRENSSIICWLVQVWAPNSFCLIPTKVWSLHTSCQTAKKMSTWCIEAGAGLPGLLFFAWNCATFEVLPQVELFVHWLDLFFICELVKLTISRLTS